MAFVAAAAAGLESGGVQRRPSIQLILKKEDELPRVKTGVRGKKQQSGVNRAGSLGQIRSTGSFDHEGENLIEVLPTTYDKKIERGAFKLCAGELWRPRVVMITNWDLLIGTPETEELMDTIPLYQISRTEKMRIEPDSAGPPKRSEKLQVDKANVSFTDPGDESSNNLSFGRTFQKKQTRKDSFPTPDSAPSRRANSLVTAEKNPEHAIKIHQVLDDDYNSEALHLVGFHDEAECDEWLAQMRKSAAEAAAAFKTRRRFLEWQFQARRIYESKVTQSLIALIIFANFVSDVYEVQKYGGNNEDKDVQAMFERLDLGFTIVFAVELLINMVVNISPTEYLMPFFRNGWNCFDFVIVGFSLISLALPDVSGVNTIRLLRGFRVFRLFGRFESMRRMIASLSASIIPVINALVVLLLIVSVYAVLGVKLFWHTGTRHFTTFVDSFLTMFQVVTYDNWSSEVLLPMSGEEDDDSVDIGAMIFLISFIIIVGWCVLPVVMAVLIDNFMDTKNRFRQKEKTQEKLGDEQLHRALDPLLEYLSYFETPSDLNKKIETLFRNIDRDGSGTIDYEEFRDGVKRMQLTNSSHLSRDDYDSITEGGAFCNRKGQLGPVEFQMMMKHQLQLYVSRHANSWMTCGKNGNVTTMLFALKMMMMQLPVLEQTSEDRFGRKHSSGDTTAVNSLSSKYSDAAHPHDNILRTIIADQKQIMDEHKVLMSAVSKIAEKLNVQLDPAPNAGASPSGMTVPEGNPKAWQNGHSRLTGSVTTESDASSDLRKDQDRTATSSPNAVEVADTAKVPDSRLTALQGLQTDSSLAQPITMPTAVCTPPAQQRIHLGKDEIQLSAATGFADFNSYSELK